MRTRSSRCLLVATISLSWPTTGCDASGSTRGGTPIIADPCSAGNLTPTWTTLYTCYFGPTGKAGCSGKTSCHGAPPPCDPSQADCLSGTIIWTCGATREGCWQGMTVQQYLCADAGSSAASSDAASEAGAVDAAAESAASDAAASAEAGVDGAAADASGPACTPLAPPIVPTGGASDPTTTLLWRALRGAPSAIGQHDMPWTPPGASPGYTFSQQDLDLISTWISSGAQDN